MASKLAMNQARESVGIFGGTSSFEPLIMAIAADLDAARAQGRREGLEEAAVLIYDGGVARIELDADLAAEIRARIEEPKAREGLEEQGAPVGWRYKVLVDRHTTGDPQPGEICMLDINRVPCYGIPGMWQYSDGPDKPAVDWICAAEPLYTQIRAAIAKEPKA